MKHIHLISAVLVLLLFVAGCYTGVAYAPSTTVAASPHGMGCSDCHMDPGYSYHYPGTYSYYNPISFSFGWSWGWGSGYPYWGSCYYNPWWYCGWGWGSCYSPCYNPCYCSWGGGGYCGLPGGRTGYYDSRTRPVTRGGRTVTAANSRSRPRSAHPPRTRTMSSTRTTRNPYHGYSRSRSTGYRGSSHGSRSSGGGSYRSSGGGGHGAGYRKR